MSGTWNRGILGVALLAAVTALGLLAKPQFGAAQSSREADGARLLKGALDLHFHMDPWPPGALNGQAGIAEVRVARSRGMRGLVIKDHNEPTAPLAYHLRQEIPGLELYGGFVMNRPNGGINPAGGSPQDHQLLCPGTRARSRCCAPRYPGRGGYWWGRRRS